MRCLIGHCSLVSEKKPSYYIRLYFSCASLKNNWESAIPARVMWTCLPYHRNESSTTSQLLFLISNCNFEHFSSKDTHDIYYVQVGIVKIIIDRINLQMVMRPANNFYNFVFYAVIFVRYKLATNEKKTIFKQIRVWKLPFVIARW